MFFLGVLKHSTMVLSSPQMAIVAGFRPSWGALPLYRVPLAIASVPCCELCAEPCLVEDRVHMSKAQR